MFKKVLFTTLALVLLTFSIVSAQETALFFAFRQIEYMEPLAYGIGEKDGQLFKWALGKSLFKQNSIFFSVSFIPEDQFWAKHKLVGGYDLKYGRSHINFRNKAPMDIIAFVTDNIKWKIVVVEWASWSK